MQEKTNSRRKSKLQPKSALGAGKSVLRIGIGLLCVALTLACSSTAPAPEPSLEEFLSLELLDFDGRLVTTGNIVTVALRNRGSMPLDLCVVTSGVSVWTRTLQPAEWSPLVMSGVSLGANCLKPLHLDPNQSYLLCADFSVPWPFWGSRRLLRAVIHVKNRHAGNKPGDPYVAIRSAETPVDIAI